MGNCSECGKKLRFWDNYIHPVKGKGYLICGNCFDLINKSMGFYKKCLFEGRQNHKNECYFWDPENKNCKNEKYFKNIKKMGNNSKNL